MQVFHFILDHRLGGPHVYVRTVRDALGPEFKSTIVTTGKGTLSDMSLTNLRHRFKSLYPLEVVWNALRLCWQFRRRCARIGVIFDVHGAANIAPLIAARFLKIPVVWHFHETVADFASLVRFGKVTLSSIPHRCVVVAKMSAQVFGIEPAHLIPGGVDISFWRAKEQKAGYRARPNGAGLRLIAVGNLNPLKGMDILLAALGRLNLRWELVIVGSELTTFSQYAASLRAYAKALARVGGHVYFVGWQTPDSVRNLIAYADVFVLPSRSEACPLALLEAMAMEAACVASAVGDVERMLGDEECGLTVPPDSSVALAAALNRIALLGEDGRREMGRRARARVVAEYSHVTMAKRHLDMYLELVRDVKELN
jgi:glycosyltransferase involved in cell wall biosynthesis